MSQQRREWLESRELPTAYGFGNNDDAYIWRRRRQFVASTKVTGANEMRIDVRSGNALVDREMLAYAEYRVFVGVQRFASHVESIAIEVREVPHLQGRGAECDISPVCRVPDRCAFDRREVIWQPRSIEQRHDWSARWLRRSRVLWASARTQVGTDERAEGLHQRVSATWLEDEPGDGDVFLVEADMGWDGWHVGWTIVFEVVGLAAALGLFWVLFGRPDHKQRS